MPFAYTSARSCCSRRTVPGNPKHRQLEGSQKSTDALRLHKPNQPAIDSSNIVDFATLGRAEPLASALDGTPRL